jgi:hypothetical protein
MTQIATSGQLADAQRIIIKSTRYTEEHNAPSMALTEQFKLENGAKTVTVPKVGEMTVAALTDGEEIILEQEIQMTTTDLTADEVGALVKITDKLVRQSQPSVFAMVGRQLGDAMARKKDTDVHALYAALNGGTTLGLASKFFTTSNATGIITFAKANKFGSQLYILVHPNTLADFVKSAAVTPGAAYPVPNGWSQDLLAKFFVGLRPLNGVPMFESGNLAIDSSGDSTGVIADKGAMATLTSVAVNVEKGRVPRLRGTEMVITSDYGVFELDDARGAGIVYSSAALSTSA